MAEILSRVNLKDRNCSIASEYGECKKGISLKDLNPSFYNLRYDTPEKKRIHDANFAFVTSTLSKVHTKMVEPLYNVTYAKDIPINVGGGFVDFVDYYTVDWIGNPGADGVTGNNVNIVPRANAQLSHVAVPVFNFEMAYDIKFIEIDKLNKLQLQKSVEAIYKDAIMASWDLFVDEIAYMGRNGSGGLFNHPDVVATTVPVGTKTSAVSGDAGFKAMTDDEIVGVFNGILSYYLINTNNNLALLPDTFLVPMTDSAELSSRYSSLLTATLREFIMNHNVGIDEAAAADEGSYKIKIKGRGRLNGMGANQAGRIVVYKNKEDFVRLDIPYGMQLYFTMPNVDKAAYTSYFVGQVSLVQLPYNKAADGAAALNGTDANGQIGAVTYWDLSKKS